MNFEGQSMPRALAKQSLNMLTSKAKAAPRLKPVAELGELPRWNLNDLYPAMDSRAFADDLAKAASECRTFSVTYKGKLEALAKKDSGAGLLEAIRRYEALEELLGRI